MICTEQEAKTKWCPQVRLTDGDVGDPFNRTATMIADGPGTAVCCIGSDCMLWVWVDMWASREGETKPNMLGTCGLIQRGAP